MKITFNGAVGRVTGSCYLVEAGNQKVIVECGMFQGLPEVQEMNYLPFNFNPKEISALILTHSHIDHCGLVPRLVNEGFTGKIWCTTATRDLCEIMLLDSAHVQGIKEREEEGGPQIYNELDVRKTMKHFRTTEYGDMCEIVPGITARFRDAGHILGSAIVELFAEENGKVKKIVFSGDLGPKNVPIVKDPEIIPDADYLVLESTYGDRLHRGFEQREEMLLGVIKHIFQKRGKLFIPSFAVERTQELLYRIRGFIEKGVLPNEKVYLDSPLAIKATGIFEKYFDLFDRDARAIRKPFHFSGLEYTRTVNQSKRLNNIHEPFIVIAGSGMCTAGRIQHHLRNGIDNHNNGVLFVGYQAEGTPGRAIKEGAKSVELFGEKHQIRAEIFSIDAFSGHADYHGLLEWVNGFKEKPRKIFLVHGEPKSAESLREKLEAHGYHAKVPKLHESFEL
ncbi:MAG: MBL fold metallo-hydrolase [Candidatus Nanoarchaeia archaeon]|nr:MBL fold metallo-hydrolase [Candidatus Nanoarchaeia archaeon]MDD5238874.1 MBL fold metallo-hydrolase [Candidatus Nanoarchaeia archaeon]